MAKIDLSKVASIGGDIIDTIDSLLSFQTLREIKKQKAEPGSPMHAHAVSEHENAVVRKKLLAEGLVHAEAENKDVSLIREFLGGHERGLTPEKAEFGIAYFLSEDESPADVAEKLAALNERAQANDALLYQIAMIGVDRSIPRRVIDTIISADKSFREVMAEHPDIAEKVRGILAKLKRQRRDINELLGQLEDEPRETMDHFLIWLFKRNRGQWENFLDNICDRPEHVATEILQWMANFPNHRERMEHALGRKLLVPPKKTLGDRLSDASEWAEENLEEFNQWNAKKARKVNRGTTRCKKSGWHKFLSWGIK